MKYLNKKYDDFLLEEVSKDKLKDEIKFLKKRIKELEGNKFQTNKTSLNMTLDDVIKAIKKRKIKSIGITTKVDWGEWVTSVVLDNGLQLKLLHGDYSDSDDETTFHIIFNGRKHQLSWEEFGELESIVKLYR